MFKVKNKDTYQNDAIGFEFEHIWTYLTPCFSVSIVNVDQVNAGWVLDDRIQRLVLKWPIRQEYKKTLF